MIFKCPTNTPSVLVRVIFPISSFSDVDRFTTVEFGMETLNLADLDSFFNMFSPTQIGQRPTFIGIDGGESICISVRYVY